MSNDKPSRFMATDSVSGEWRRRQMVENNAIEGIERDPALTEFVDRMRAEGHSPEERIKQLMRLHAGSDAAE